MTGTALTESRARGAGKQLAATPTVDGQEVALFRFPTAGSATERRAAELVPVETLRAIIAESQAALEVLRPLPHATLPQTGELAKILVGSYPKGPENSEMYSRAVMSILAEYDAATAARAVDHLTRTSRFLPSRAEVLAACRSCRYDPGARYVSAIYFARKQLEEHAERAHDAQVERDRAVVGPKLAAFRKAYGIEEPQQLSPAELAEREARASAFEAAADDLQSPATART